MLILEGKQKAVIQRHRKRRERSDVMLAGMDGGQRCGAAAVRASGASQNPTH